MENNEKTIDELKQQLETSGIDISKWGIGQAKTIEQLYIEIEQGETILTTNSEGKLLRKVLVVGADIYYIDIDGKKYHLKEEKQIFKDGRERRRDLGQAVSEKMKPNEEPEEAMIRGIKEELGIKEDILLEKVGMDNKTIISSSYPELLSEYINHRFKLMLNKNQFNPNGYEEIESDKSTYFIWEEIK